MSNQAKESATPYKLPLQQFCANVAAHPDKPYLHQPENRVWRTLTWGQVDDQARRIATGLLANGLAKGDRVAILAKNSAEWFIVDVAIMMAGMISVPIYATAGESTIRHVLAHSGAKALFVGKLDSTEAAEAAVGDELLTIAFPYPTATSKEQWNDWLKRYEPLQELPEPQPDDVFTLVYTSGSTGLPKGVVLTQDNVASASYSAQSLLKDGGELRTISYLPLAHITERCVVELPSLYRPGDIFFTESLATFVEDLKHAKPTLFVSVPRLWAKFQAQVLSQIPDEQLQSMLKDPATSEMVKSQIRKGLGFEHAQTFGSGSAPISPSILEWFARLGIEISEGWGMTETSGLSCGNNPITLERLGTIGVPVQCVEMKLSDEGEVLIRGPAVFKEYYNNPEATAESFVDGWFRTGDRAEIRADGAWKIIGRVKEQFKTAKGKYVAPVPIESLFGTNPDVEQVCVLGSGRKQPLAVVVLSEAIKSRSSEVKDRLQASLDEINRQLESHQRLDSVIVAHTPWSIENELLTPTMKLKRDRIENRYRQYLETNLPGSVVWEEELT
jgi:long-subunit acyl-CoA synthetase (AMP-forming)